jgi:hypothetical protein
MFPLVLSPYWGDQGGLFPFVIEVPGSYPQQDKPDKT